MNVTFALTILKAIVSVLSMLPKNTALPQSFVDSLQQTRLHALHHGADLLSKAPTQPKQQ